MNVITGLFLNLFSANIFLTISKYSSIFFAVVGTYEQPNGILLQDCETLFKIYSNELRDI